MSLPADLAPRIVALLERAPLPLSDEKQLQADMLALLKADGLDAVREVRLDQRDIVDFMIFDGDFVLTGLAIEVKIKGQRRAIYRQLERYCAHPRVNGILLATNVAMSLPAEIEGKPACVARLGRAWL
ncbi:hypothetical protein [Bradyrhizobium sp. SRS-191]|uniref:hypothetical protein n=1 Tax=Bradyrhizobium sp. SRS-191 TaxID=2962606 RepID=UPI00211F322D|nr:hypothetical protein [Bradyrhizobium sp. SRS-191]